MDCKDTKKNGKFKVFVWYYEELFLYLRNKSKELINMDTTIYSSLTDYGSEESKNSVKDKSGVIYSADGKKLLDANPGLESCVIPDGVEVICDTSFYRCYRLKTIYIPDSVIAIGREAFNECYQLHEIRMSHSLEYIGPSAFYRCRSLTQLQLPNTLACIGISAFKDCIMLQGISISARQIQAYSFSGCHSLRYCYCCIDTTDIGERAFEWCVNLESIVFNEKSDGSIISEYLGTSCIDKHAFEGCTSLKRISLPSLIKFIGRDSFRYCYSLEEITFGSKVKSVDPCAFLNCTSLKKINIPDDGYDTYEALKEFKDCLELNYQPLREENDISIESFVIGEKFPWHEYAYIGDHTTPVLNQKSFDVIVSLCDVTWKEKKALTMIVPTISIFIHKTIPFIILNFDDVILVQFSINIKKLKPEAMDKWLDSDNNFVRCFLLEGNNGTLEASMYFNYNQMGVLKRLLTSQRSLTKGQIDDIIQEGESKYSIYEMIACATYTGEIK